MYIQVIADFIDNRNTIRYQIINIEYSDEDQDVILRDEAAQQ
jgi:hypothetical protein